MAWRADGLANFNHHGVLWQRVAEKGEEWCYIAANLRCYGGISPRQLPKFTCYVPPRMHSDTWGQGSLADTVWIWANKAATAWTEWAVNGVGPLGSACYKYSLYNKHWNTCCNHFNVDCSSSPKCNKLVFVSVRTDARPELLYFRFWV